MNGLLFYECIISGKFNPAKKQMYYVVSEGKYIQTHIQI